MMSTAEPLYWLTGLGDAKLHNAVAFHQDYIGILRETRNEKLAKSLSEGGLSPDTDTKSRWIRMSDIRSVVRSPDYSVVRIEYGEGKRAGLAATPQDIPKLQRVFEELKARIAPTAELEQTQATFREAVEAPSAILGLVLILMAAIYFAFGGEEEAAEGRKGFGRILTAIGFDNLMWGLGGFAALILLWLIIRVVHRPPMIMFRSGA